MAKIRVTLTKEQAQEVMVALYRAGNPLGDRFRDLVDTLEVAEQSEESKREATSDSHMDPVEAVRQARMYEAAAEYARVHNLLKDLWK